MLGQAGEEDLHGGVDVHGTLVLEKPREGGDHPVQCALAGGHGAVATHPPALQAQPVAVFLSVGDHKERCFRHQVEGGVTPLVDHQVCLQLLGVVLQEHPGAGVAARLLVGDGKEDHVTLEYQSLPRGGDEGHELHDPHALHIQSPSAPDKAVGDLAGEGMELPVLGVGGDHVYMVEEDERFTLPRSLEAGQE